MGDDYLAAVVPLIVNAVLNEHQLVIDVIAFVARGDFPRSRLGEKQRGKILSQWVTRKLSPSRIAFANSSRTIEQFTVRDPEDDSRRSTSIRGISLRDEVSANGQVQARDSVGSPVESIGGRLLIEDGSVENKPTRMPSWKMY